MATIALEGMEFFAYHGCFKEEQIIGSKFMVDLFLDADTSEAEKSDSLEATINYQSAYIIVKREMQENSQLLEHVGRRILNALKAEFPQITGTTLKISKLNPPIGGKIEKVSLCMQM